MDEVDNIIIHSLRQIGCTIEEDVISLSSFSPELLVETISKCLHLIKPSLNKNIPKNLPTGMAQRFAVTNTLAEACTAIGFRGDIGYQTFLYSNVTEVRRVYMFLIERLPKETEKLPLTQPLDKLSTLENEILRNMRVQLKSPWIPQYCNKMGIRQFDDKTYAVTTECIKFNPQLYLNIPHSIEDMKNLSSELSNYWLKRSPSIFQQTNSQTLCPTIIHNMELDLYYDKYDKRNIIERTNDIIDTIISKCNNNNSNNNNSNNNNNNNSNDNSNITTTGPSPSTGAIPKIKSADKLTIQKTKSDSKLLSLKNCGAGANGGNNIINNNKLNNNYENVNLIKSFSPLDELEENVEKLKKSIDSLLLKRKSIQAEIIQLQQNRIKKEQDVMALKEIRKIKERSCILLENPEVNLAKMESVIAATNERMKKLQVQWEEHRGPLVNALEKTKAKNSSSNSQNKQIMDQLKLIRDKLTDITEDLNFKTEHYTQLINEFQKIDKTVSRNSYTTRILEIVGNIRKQKNDIDKVLRDTRELQKQINNISGQLDRQFTVTDDLLFKTAKRDEYSKRAYKLLATLHSDCNDLVALVQETGSIMREVRDIEDQIEMEKSRNISINLEKITFDLKQMEKESKELQEKIHKVENQITQG